MKGILMLLIMIVNLSCVENKNLKGQTENNVTTNKVISDTLKFTSGIRSIIQDRNGNYWIGSDQEGVCKYDGKTFTYYTTENGFCGKQVIYIKEDSRGLIWFGTTSGLCSFDGILFSYPSNQVPVSPWKAEDGDLWFPGEKDGEIIRINRGELFVHKNPIIIPKGKNPRDFGITGFTKSNHGGVWISHYFGVVHYNGKKTTQINDSIMHFDGIKEYMHVRSLLEDSNGRLWIGNNGIGVQLKEKDSIYNFSKKFGLVYDDIFAYPAREGTLMHVFAIKEDSKGRIWFGDRDTGAWMYDGQKMKNYILDTSLSSQHIWDIYEDRNGNLLFTSGDRGVYKFNGNGFERFL